MMRSNFKIAFRIGVLHSYFEKNLCTCLQFNPGPVTKSLSGRFNFKRNKRINGFDFYINTSLSLPGYFDYLYSSTGQSYFDFGIVTNNHAFNFFTELPVDQIRQLVYDSNSTLNNYENEIVLLGMTLSENAPLPELGKLIVRFEDIIKFNNDKGYTEFSIRFNARSTQWQYYVINKSAIPLDNPAISKTGISFAGPENVVIENGQAAMLFSSGDQLIPLSQAPKYKFDLVNTPKENGDSTTQKKAAPKIIFRGLPNPNPERIGMTQVNGKNQVSSPMYVYV